MSRSPGQAVVYLLLAAILAVWATQFDLESEELDCPPPQRFSKLRQNALVEFLTIVVQAYPFSSSKKSVDTTTDDTRALTEVSLETVAQGTPSSTATAPIFPQSRVTGSSPVAGKYNSKQISRGKVLPPWTEALSLMSSQRWSPLSLALARQAPILGMKS